MSLIGKFKNIFLSGDHLHSIAVELTTRCNLSCKMCGFWKRQKQDLPYEKVSSILEEAYKLGARRFDPWGTELFMRDDIVDILAYAERIGFHEIYVVSNGTLFNKPHLLDRLEKLKSLVLIISIDGPEAVHDNLRGDGVYGAAVSSLREIVRRGIKTSIASIIMRPTLDHLHHIIDLSADLDIPVISMQPYCRALANRNYDHSTFEFSADKKEFLSTKINDLLKYAKQKQVVIYTENILKHTASYLSEGISPFPPGGCHVPSRTLVVDIDGNIHPCFEIPQNMGNVNHTKLSAMWHKDIHKTFILSALEKKCGGCLRSCSDIEGYNG